MAMINIINLGIGNVASIANWVSKKTDEINLINRPKEYRSGHIILPGVCSATELMRRLKQTNLDALILEEAKAQKSKIIGICAGFQVMGKRTSEDDGIACLNLIPLEVEKITMLDGRISNTGWDHISLDTSKPTTRLSNDFRRNKKIIGEAYFNHRYGFRIRKNEVCSAAFGSANGYLTHWISNNIYGFQFHPEKSGTLSQRLLEILK